MYVYRNTAARSRNHRYHINETVCSFWVIQKNFVPVNNKINTENAAMETQQCVLIYCCAILTYVAANMTHAGSSRKATDIFVQF
jgi:hypothetical protein